MARITRTNGAVKVNIDTDRMGHLSVTLCSAKLAKAWAKQAHDDGETLRDGAYIQLSQDIEEFLNDVSPQARRDLKDGNGTVNCFINDELAMAMFNVAY